MGLSYLQLSESNKSGRHVGTESALHCRAMRKLTAALLVLAAVVLGGCSSQPINVVTDGTIHLPALPSYTFYVDPDVGPDGELAVDEAVRQWTEFTNVQIQVTSGPDYVCVVEAGCFTVYEIPRSELDTLTLDSSYIGYTFLGVIAVANDMPWDELQDTMVHEFGHALGLVHHPLPAFAVMNPDYRGAGDAVECDDVNQFYAVRNEPTPATPLCFDGGGALDETADGGPSPSIVEDAAYPVNFDAALLGLDDGGSN
jgi:hypothetical protein